MGITKRRDLSPSRKASLAPPDIIIYNMVEEKFKVLTFNCWAVFFPSPTVRKEDRVNAIAAKLSVGDFDVILLQELIARYELDRMLDKYNGHRISQLVEIMEFVRMTSTGSDAIIITGDFNLESNTSAIELFSTSLKLSDAWLNNTVALKNTNITELESEGCTCDRADNPYRNQLWTNTYGNGERLDYIFYRSGPSIIDSFHIPSYAKLVCDSCWLDMRKVPDDPYGLHYSDHEGVAASFTITRLRNPVKPEGETMSANELNRLRDLLLDIDQQLTRGLNQCIHGRLLHLIWAIFITILLIILILIYPTDRLTSIIKCLFEILLGIILFTLIWGSLIGRTIEKSGLKNAKHSISTLSSRLDKGETMSANELNRLRDLLLDIDQQLTRGLNQCIHGRLLHLIWAIFITILLIILILIYPTDRLTSIIKCLFEILLGIILFTLIWGSLIGRTIEKSGLKNAKHSISTLSSRLDSSNDFTLIK
ncbi:sphingomyelin phosphodiesterase 2 [Schistosoma bovis]|uniref:Sphingomyelin phosphodiesterase 2 n=2 Tax=Schistosoma TaxID=6181 RepID=A0A430QD27_SCHBO|nr:sphingomyelin phosphodiesterase 2 [Schistosoma bovis]